MSDQTTGRVPCANEDHGRPTPAVARLSWPDGRYVPATACVGDLNRIVRDSLHDGHTLLVEPVTERTGEPYVTYTVTHQVKDLIRLHLRERGREPRAVLLEAPDMPHNEALPETIEERRKLPPRFHVPHWLDTCTPKVWVCAVCWDEGSTTSWPCEVAREHGGEVFAR